MVDFAVYSDPGSRETNEDYISCFTGDNKFCFVIADGLGGEGSGDMASRFVCNHTVVLAEKAKTLDGEFLKESFGIIQKNLLRAKKELLITSGMTSTLSIVLFDGGKASWGHIGDSRIYWLKNGGIKQISVDHSLAQFMISSGISENMDVREHPDRSTLMAAMGMENMGDAYEIDASGVEMNEAMSFLMCTDGFWQYVREDELLAVAAMSVSAEDTINRLVKIAKKNAGSEERDNLSAIFIKYIPD